MVYESPKALATPRRERWPPTWNIFSSEFVTRGHNFKLFKPHAQKNVRSKFFSVRTITPWNNLPNEVVISNSTDNFILVIISYVRNEQDSQAYCLFLVFNNNNNNNNNKRGFVASIYFQAWWVISSENVRLNN